MNLCIFISLQLLVGCKQQDKIGKLNSWKSQLLHFITAIYIYSVHCSKLKLWQLCIFQTCLLPDTFPGGLHSVSHKYIPHGWLQGFLRTQSFLQIQGDILHPCFWLNLKQKYFVYELLSVISQKSREVWSGSMKGLSWRNV